MLEDADNVHVVYYTVVESGIHKIKCNREENVVELSIIGSLHVHI